MDCKIHDLVSYQEVLLSRACIEKIKSIKNQLTTFFFNLKRNVYKSNRKIFHIIILTPRRLGEFEMQCYNPPPLFCVQMRVCKQGNVCKLLISWILKYSFTCYLIQNIFRFQMKAVVMRNWPPQYYGISFRKRQLPSKKPY